MPNVVRRGASGPREIHLSRNQRNEDGVKVITLRKDMKPVAVMNQKVVSHAPVSSIVIPLQGVAIKKNRNVTLNINERARQRAVPHTFQWVTLSSTQLTDSHYIGLDISDVPEQITMSDIFEWVPAEGVSVFAARKSSTKEATQSLQLVFYTHEDAIIAFRLLQGRHIGDEYLRTDLVVPNEEALHEHNSKLREKKRLLQKEEEEQLKTNTTQLRERDYRTGRDAQGSYIPQYREEYAHQYNDTDYYRNDDDHMSNSKYNEVESVAMYDEHGRYIPQHREEYNDQYSTSDNTKEYRSNNNDNYNNHDNTYEEEDIPMYQEQDAAYMNDLPSNTTGVVHNHTNALQILLKKTPLLRNPVSLPGCIPLPALFYRIPHLDFINAMIDPHYNKVPVELHALNHVAKTTMFRAPGTAEYKPVDSLWYLDAMNTLPCNADTTLLSNRPEFNTNHACNAPVAMVDAYGFETFSPTLPLPQRIPNNKVFVSMNEREPNQNTALIVAERAEIQDSFKYFANSQNSILTMTILWSDLTLQYAHKHKKTLSIKIAKEALEDIKKNQQNPRLIWDEKDVIPAVLIPKPNAQKPPHMTNKIRANIDYSKYNGKNTRTVHNNMRN